MGIVEVVAKHELHKLKQELVELRLENQRLLGLAYRDSLTGLRNRRFFSERLGEELCRLKRGRKSGLTVIVIDVNGFKTLNDTLGHAAGDVALAAVGALLESLTRTSDLVCRVGGDEFAILLPDSDATQAERVVERIRSTMSTLVKVGLGETSLALGVASFQDGDDELRMLARADEQMYCDKRTAGQTQTQTQKGALQSAA